MSKNRAGRQGARIIEKDIKITPENIQQQNDKSVDHFGTYDRDKKNRKSGMSIKNVILDS